MVTVVIGILAGGIVDNVTSGTWPVWLIGVSLVSVVGMVSLWDWWREHQMSPPQLARAPVRSVPVPSVPDWVVDRPDELDDVVGKVCGRPGGAVGITTALRGAGGFGKTTLAQLVVADQRVQRWFGGRVYQVTIGRDVRDPAAVAGKVNNAIELVTGERSGLTDPAGAGQRLGQILDSGSSCLLVLDDVWEAGQLAPFLIGGRRCVRLVTTRVVQALPASAATVLVDRMSPAQARAVLLWGLPELPERTARRLLEATGGWPLLLRLVNRILHDAHRVGQRLDDRAEDLVTRLAAGGPTALDHLVSGPRARLDVNVPEERARAVRATIEASSLCLGSDDDRARLLELGVFAEDEAVPVRLVERLWAATADTDAATAAGLCGDLDRLALVRLGRDEAGTATLTVHDVIRSHLRSELGEERLRTLNAVLLDAVAAQLPAASPLAGAKSVGPAWWSLPETERYLWNTLAFHAAGAGQPDSFDTSVGDLRWVTARLLRWGPATPIADLAHGSTARAAGLRGQLLQQAHLLGPTEPAAVVVDVLLDRLRAAQAWRSEAEAVQATVGHLHLEGRVPAVHRPETALRRTLTGHSEPVSAVAVAPDGTWLVSAGSESDLVRMWRTDTDAPVRYFDHSAVCAIAVAPDGTWLVTGGYGTELRVWDVATGDLLAGGPRRGDSVTALAAAGDCRSFACGTSEGVVRVWDAGTLRPLATLQTSLRTVNAVAVAPDGGWLAAGGLDGLVVWRPGEQNPRTLTADWVKGIVIGPHGRWLATADYPHGVRCWDPATGEVTRAIDTDGQTPASLTAAPDGSWLAAGMEHDGTVRIWDTRSGALRTTLAGHTGQVGAVVAAPDGSWLATGGADRTVRLWSVASDALEPAVRRPRRRRARSCPAPTSVEALAVAPAGDWLATGGHDNDVWLWEAATGVPRRPLIGRPYAVDWMRAVAFAPDGSLLAAGTTDGYVLLREFPGGDVWAELTGHTDTVEAVAFTPDGRVLVSGGRDGTVRLWNASTAEPAAVWRAHTGAVHAIAVAPDGTWLVSAGEYGPGPDYTTLVVWDIASGTPQASLDQPGSQSVAIPPDGAWFATGSHDGQIQLYTPHCRLLGNLEGHSHDVTALAISPDGARLASAGEDGTLRIWDLATRRCLTQMRTDTPLHSCVWLRSGDAVAVTTGTGMNVFDLRGTTPQRA